MTVTAQELAAGPGWRVVDVVCENGPHDRRFEEQHADISLAVVTRGTFQYRTRQGSAVLVPGAVLLGNAGACFECGHDHGHGDRCLAFHVTPAFMDAVASSVPGARPKTFPVASLPPMRPLLPLLAAAEAARDDGDSGAFEELTLRLAGAVTTLLAQQRPPRRQAHHRDEQRVSAAARRIERHADEALSLGELAREAGLSPYHFLRTFRQVIGMTPHQFILHTRLHRAAVRLRRTGDAISTIAYDAGFNDLSTFNRRFRRLMGANPGDYRAARSRG